MKFQQITAFQTREVLFCGYFDTYKACLEDAVKNGVNLRGVDLSHKNLSNACLDEAHFEYALFENTNLTGANLSGTKIKAARFINAALQNTCFCEAQLEDIHFTGSAFGSTDMAGSILNRCVFNTLSALQINFRDCNKLGGNVFQTACGRKTTFNRPPVYVQNLDWPVVLFDHDMMVGSYMHSYCDWDALFQNQQRRFGRRQEKISSHILNFWRNHRSALMALALSTGRYGITSSASL